MDGNRLVHICIEKRIRAYIRYNADAWLDAAVFDIEAETAAGHGRKQQKQDQFMIDVFHALEFKGVTERRQDRYDAEGLAGETEPVKIIFRELIVFAKICQNGIHVAIDVVDAQIPYALITSLGRFPEVETDIKSMIIR